MSARKIAHALRVTQLDTTELDASAMRLLSDQLQACFKHKINGFDLMLVEPHIRTAMYVLLLYSTLWKNGQTIGQKLLHLRYGLDKTFDFPSKSRLLVLQSLLTLKLWLDTSKSFGRPWFTKFDSVQRLSKRFETLYDFFSLINFLVFLRQGHFHTLLHRIAGLRSVYVDSNPLKRNISYHMMSREILWQGYAETGVFFLSLINVSKLRRKFSELFLNEAKDDKKEILNSCGFCKQIPVMPYVGSCKIHAHCYYCVSTALCHDEGSKCPTCGVLIEAISPLECKEIVISKLDMDKVLP